VKFELLSESAWIIIISLEKIQMRLVRKHLFYSANNRHNIYTEHYRYCTDVEHNIIYCANTLNETTLMHINYKSQ